MIVPLNENKKSFLKSSEKEMGKNNAHENAIIIVM